MFNEIEQIRSGLLFDLKDIAEDKGNRKLITDYFGKDKKTFTRDEVHLICKVAIERISNKIDNKLSMYLYNEAKALKDVIDRIDSPSSDDDC